MKEALQTREVCDPVWISGSHHKPILQLHDEFKPHKPIMSARGSPALPTSPAAPVRHPGTRALSGGTSTRKAVPLHASLSCGCTHYLLCRGQRTNSRRVAWGFYFSTAMSVWYLKPIM